MKLSTLYKRAVNGKVNEWTVEIENNCFRTISGYTDGVKTTSEWTCCSGKNIGKKNETTPEQQALAEAQAMWTKKLELGSYESIDDIDTPKFFNPMLASGSGTGKFDLILNRQGNTTALATSNFTAGTPLTIGSDAALRLESR